MPVSVEVLPGEDFARSAASDWMRRSPVRRGALGPHPVWHRRRRGRRHGQYWYAPSTERAATAWCPEEISPSTSFAACAFSPMRMMIVRLASLPVAASTPTRNGNRQNTKSTATTKALFMKSTALSRDQNVPTGPALTRSAVAVPLASKTRAFACFEASALGVELSDGGEGPLCVRSVPALPPDCPS